MSDIDLYVVLLNLTLFYSGLYFVVWHKGFLHLFHKADADQFSISQALVREDIGSEGSINASL